MIFSEANNKRREERDLYVCRVEWLDGWQRCFVLPVFIHELIKLYALYTYGVYKSGSVGHAVVGPRILGCLGAYAPKHPKIRPLTTGIPTDPNKIFLWVQKTSYLRSPLRLANTIYIPDINYEKT